MWHLKWVLGFAFAALMGAAVAMAADPLADLDQRVSPETIAGARRLLEAGASAQLVVSASQGMRDSGFSDAQFRAGYQILLDAHREGTPLAPLVGKLHEGRTKGVPPDRILTALTAVKVRHAFAITQAGTIAQDPVERAELSNLIVAGLAAGLNQAQVADLVRALTMLPMAASRPDSNEVIRESFSAARDMTRLGVAPETASQIVTGALSQGYTASDLAGLRSSFNQSSGRQSAQSLAASVVGQLSGSKGGLTSTGGHGSGQSSGGSGTGPGSGPGGGPGGGGSGGAGGGPGGGPGGGGGGGSGGGPGGGPGGGAGGGSGGGSGGGPSGS